MEECLLSRCKIDLYYYHYYEVQQWGLAVDRMCPVGSFRAAVFSTTLASPSVKSYHQSCQHITDQTQPQNMASIWITFNWKTHSQAQAGWGFRHHSCTCYYSILKCLNNLMTIRPLPHLFVLLPTPWGPYVDGGQRKLEVSKLETDAGWGLCAFHQSLCGTCLGDSRANSVSHRVPRSFFTDWQTYLANDTLWQIDPANDNEADRQIQPIRPWERLYQAQQLWELKIGDAPSPSDKLLMGREAMTHSGG